MTINEVQFSDEISIEEYNNLRKSVGWLKLTETQAKKVLERSTSIVCGRIDNQIVAMGRVNFDGYIAFIADIVIVPEYQRRGLGTWIVEKLIATVLEEVETNQLIQFILIAAAKKEPFYESIGFSKCPSGQFGAGMRKVIKK